jgi:hypothetical protein
MTDPDHHEIRRILKDAVPPVRAGLDGDLWPRMLRRLDTPERLGAQGPRVTWYDWALAGLVGAAVLSAPDLVLVLVYYL